MSSSARSSNSQLNRRLLRLKQAGRYLSVSDKRIRALILDGELPYIRMGRGNAPFLIDVRDLDRFIETHKER